jgi:hypothetical protein
MSTRLRFPSFLTVRQQFESRRIDDIPAAVQATLSESGMVARLKPGATVAIGVGSRGIAKIDVIARAAVAFWKQQGMQPFLFPAMGSHGAATASGQAAVLAKYGITEATMGCPVRSSLAVAEVGVTAEGIRVVMDRTAWRAGGVMLCGRVKWHTDFEGALESGLFKMMAIGLGKFAGAKRYHDYGFHMGLEAMIRSVGRVVLGSGRILGGLAILEDANHETARVEAVPVENMERREEELLALAKSWMPRIPVDLDVLMVNELGKNFAGSGLDAKVVNRGVWGAINPWAGQPQIGRIYVRGLSGKSYGNAAGMGMADVVHRRFLKAVKRRPTYLNCLTSSQPAAIRTPMHFATDRECLEAICGTVGRLDAADLRLGWIANTLELGRMALTANLRGELEQRPGIEIEGPARELEFDAKGDLVDWLAGDA